VLTTVYSESKLRSKRKSLFAIAYITMSSQPSGYMRIYTYYILYMGDLTKTDIMYGTYVYTDYIPNIVCSCIICWICWITSTDNLIRNQWLHKENHTTNAILRLISDYMQHVHHRIIKRQKGRHRSSLIFGYLMEVEGDKVRQRDSWNYEEDLNLWPYH